MGAFVSMHECVLLVVRNQSQNLAQKCSEQDAWFRSLNVNLQLPVHFATITTNSSADLELCLREIAQFNADGQRNRLLVEGPQLEDVVTFLTLEALAFGFDVYLLTDAIETLSPSIASFHWDQLYQAGAVPTSVAQMLREWAVTSSDSSVVKKICECEIEFKTIKNCV